MRLTSSERKFQHGYLFFLIVAVVSPVVLGKTTAHLQPRIAITVQEHRVSAREISGRGVYRFDPASTALLRNAEEIRNVAISKNVGNLVLIFVRVPSRPGRMGLGYCGAGFEDYLLLVGLERQRLIFRDKFLLQSCLSGKFINTADGQEDPIKLLIRKPDGSFDFRLEADELDQIRNLSIIDRRFVLKFLPSDEN
jgi:hypothetical protein